MRYLGLDIGEKTIGVAVSDAFEMTAQPIKTIVYKKLNQAIGEIYDIALEREVDCLVVGLPLHNDGTIGLQAQKVQDMAQKILNFFDKKNKPIQLEYEDERFSTKEAQEVLIRADVSRKKRKKVIDKMAAVIILQAFLDSKT